MSLGFIITVNESDFEYEVIAYSTHTPVVVDFWAEWCVPCKTITPMLERFTQEADGTFRLAKVDVDDNPNLALRFNVRSIPHLKAFRDKQVVAEFIGAQSEPRLREFLRSLAPSQTDLTLEKGFNQILSLDWVGAENSFLQFLEKSPDYPPALLGLLKSVLMQGRIREASDLQEAFPASHEYAASEALRPLIDALGYAQKTPTYSDEPLEAAYLNALRLVLRGNPEAAIDGMLDILRQDKHYRSDGVRRVLLALLEVLGEDNPHTPNYRRELSTILF
jgi:putative thioredoxin